MDISRIEAMLDRPALCDATRMLTALADLPGTASEKAEVLLALRKRQSAPVATACVDMALFFVGHPSGESRLLEGLHSADAQVRKLAFDQLNWIGIERGRQRSFDVADEVLLPVLADYLASPITGDGLLAMRFVLAECRAELLTPYILPLLDQGDLGLQDTILQGILARGQDGGVLDFLSRELLRPGLSVASADLAWCRMRWIQCRLLLQCAQKTRDEAVRQRLGQLVLVALRVAMAAPDRNERFNHSSCDLPTSTGWLDAGPLLKTLALCRPLGAASLLAEIVSTADAPARLRSYALIAHVQLLGRAPPNAVEIIEQMFEFPPASSGEDRLQALVDLGLVDVDRVIQAWKSRPLEGWRGWNWCAYLLIEKWPQGVDDKQLIAALMQELSDMVGDLSKVDGESLETVIGLLQRFSWSAQDKQEALVFIHQGLEKAGSSSEFYAVASGLLRQLKSLGEISIADYRAALFRAGSEHSLYSEEVDDLLRTGFVAGTLVHTPAGTVPINELQVGDVVLSRSYDANGHGEVAGKRVTRIGVHDGRQIMNAGYRSMPSSQSYGVQIWPLFTVRNHPFWMEGEGWVPAARVHGRFLLDTAGVRLLDGATFYADQADVYQSDRQDIGWVGNSPSMSEGYLHDFMSGEKLEDCYFDESDWPGDGSGLPFKTVAYDLEVEEFHTYFVGARGVWVHDASVGGSFRREFAAQIAAAEKLMRAYGKRPESS